MDNKRRRKSLKLKVEHLKLELEDREEETSKIEKEFLELLASLEVEEIPHAPQSPLPGQVEIKQPVEGSGEEEVQPASPIQDHPEEFKKIWKQVAAATHPDKTNNDPEATELYKRATAAWNSGNYADLIGVAMELGIDIPEQSNADLEVLQSAATDLEGRIKSLEGSVLWEWRNAPPDKKDRILDLYLGSKGKKRKKG
jgi:hypothetical protein